ncbi:oxidoreductase [Leifsonia sp. Root227]|uniref:FAD-binding and (Fe-S)-binding domain-containing protein n=1 Tax=Leifsonia sp. Root227 TaxID=1736496 RepID=UPI0006F451DE|nr:FAD-binding and (Fe-S)-binding domain-containing protein [Leifsonia sp. Root227]KRC47347.1 oxidoreductase [Leifsonia sp. Root227]
MSIAAPAERTTGVTGATGATRRHAIAHDASHYLLIPSSVESPETVGDVADLMRRVRAAGTSLTFRSGGTSLSGQGSTAGVLADTRRHFRAIRVLDDGMRVRVGPGATVRQVNASLARHGRKLGPDPASEVACTIGGVLANNSSGMVCGITQNSYRTVESLVVVLPSGTVVDTALPDADAALASAEPELHSGLTRLRERVLADPASVATVERLFSRKNTMGYGVNALLDFERPVDILAHLMIGSEGTLGFISSATFRTVPVLGSVATGLAVFRTLADAAAATSVLADAGFATVELMDATSLRVARQLPDCPDDIAALAVDRHAALLIELQAGDAATLAAERRRTAAVLDALPVVDAVVLSPEPARRASLWHLRKGLYTAVAGARPSGTTALLEDVAVPVENLGAFCDGLIALFDRFGYENSVIFGHAKDGNVHFMLTERFDQPELLARYRAFTEAMVDLVLEFGGSLKAEHGTGRVMAPFVSRQYGDELYAVMWEIKRLFDPTGMLNPGVLLSDDPDSYLRDLKITSTVESEVDRCVECGYCEPACPSRDLTLTPRQRIVLRREMADAERRGDSELLEELRSDYEYQGVETCAVDGMCQSACPVGINTGDLVRRLRAETAAGPAAAVWGGASRQWGAVTAAAGAALTIAKALPAPAVKAATVVGRSLLGADQVPLYSAELPGGGRARRARAAAEPVAVFFPACVGTMFGAPGGALSASEAFIALCERAGVEVSVPDGIGSLCCGTPWKSKGYTAGYERMSDRVREVLTEATDGGRLPVVCDASSCTEGLALMAESAGFRVVDSIAFAGEHLLPALTVTEPIGSMVLHPTCSSAQLGIDPVLTSLASSIAAEVVTPVAWGCCAFAGDRGLLHPELTASATAAEAAEVASGSFDAYASTNRTCELGMTRAVGEDYEHILVHLERATRQQD